MHATGRRVRFWLFPSRRGAGWGGERSLRYSAMTILEAGIIAGGCVGTAIGGTLGRSHGVLAVVGCGTGGLLAGAAAGCLFAGLLICLLSVIGVIWQAARKRPADPPSEADMGKMNPVAVGGTFASAAAGAVALAAWSWLWAMIVVTTAALITAMVAVARSEFLRAE